MRIGQKLREGRTWSFEFMPPKTPAGHMTLGRTVADLERLEPDFVSVTYGAGGSDRHRTGDVVGWMSRETSFEPMAHLTCRGHTRTDVAHLLVDYRRLGVENLLILGGDPPKDGKEEAGDYTYAIELLEEAAETGSFSFGVAAHPEVHPRSPSREIDRQHLAAKLRIADFAITQFFFEAEHWVRLVDELAELGVEKPVLPGIMPITDLGQVQRMAALSGAEVPQWLVDRLSSVDDPAQVRRIGVEAAIELCLELLEVGAPGLHLYTLT